MHYSMGPCYHRLEAAISTAAAGLNNSTKQRRRHRGLTWYGPVMLPTLDTCVI